VENQFSLLERRRPSSPPPPARPPPLLRPNQPFFEACLLGLRFSLPSSLTAKVIAFNAISCRSKSDSGRNALGERGRERAEASRRATNCRVGFPVKVTVQYPRAVTRTCALFGDGSTRGSLCDLSIKSITSIAHTNVQRKSSRDSYSDVKPAARERSARRRIANGLCGFELGS